MADVSVVLPVHEAVLPVGLVIDHPSDTEGIDVAEAADGLVGPRTFLFVVLLLQVVLESVAGIVSPVVRRELVFFVGLVGCWLP